MASAMIGGMIENGVVAKEDIIASVRTQASRERVAREFGIVPAGDNREVAEGSDVLFVAVKPQFYQEVIQEIAGVVRADQIVISIAPGKTLEWLSSLLGEDRKIVRYIFLAQSAI